MKKYVITILFLLPGMLLSHIYQDSYWFERLDLEKSKIDEVVFSISQDSIGYMWFGTRDGIYKYDGRKTVHYDKTLEPGGLTDNKVFNIYTDKDGIVWILTGASLERFDSQSNKFVDIELPEGHDKYDVVTEDDNSNLVLASYSGEILILNKKNHSQRKINNLNIRIHDVIIFENKIYMATELGLLTYNVDKNKIDKLILKKRCYSLEVYNSNNLLIGLKNKIVVYNTSDNQIDELVDFPIKGSPKRVWRICKGNDDNIWVSLIGHRLYLFNMETRDLRYAREEDGIYNLDATPPIFSIYKSYSGTIWVGSPQTGLFKSKMRSNVKHFSKSNSGLLDNNIKSLFGDNQGRVWIGNSSNSINIYYPEEDKFEAIEEVIPGQLKLKPAIMCFLQDEKGRIWSGAKSYLIRIFENKQMHRYKIPDSLMLSNAHFIKSIEQLNDRELILATLGSGILRFDIQTGEFAKLSQSFHESTIRKRALRNCGNIEIDKQGNIWAGAYNLGLIKYDIKVDSIINKISSLGKKINNIFYEDSSNIWICSRIGLYHYDDVTKKSKRYTIENGLLSNNVSNIVKIDDKIYWLSTNIGMVKFNSETGTFTNYSKNHNFTYFQNRGEQSKYLWSGEDNTLVYSQDSTIYIGGPNGINVFNTKKITPEFNSPKIHITGLSITGIDTNFATPFHKLKELELTYRDYKFTFDYNIFSYHMPEANQLVYKLEGYNNKWIKTRQGNFTFSNVPTGTYRLKLRGRDAYGNWADGSTLKVTIVPPFWKTTKFMILVALLSILTVYGVIKYRTRAIQEKKKILDRKVKIRTKELNLKKNELQKAHDKLEERVLERTKQLLKSNKMLREEIDERERVQKALKESRKDIKNNLQQQEALAEIALLFNTMEDYPQKLQRTIEKIQTYTETDNVWIYEKKRNENILELSHKIITKNYNNPERWETISGRAFQQLKSYFQDNELLRAEDIYKFPHSLADDFKTIGIKSLVVFPILIKDNFIGILGVSNMTDAKNWKSSEINFLRTVAHILSNAYQKNIISQNLIRSERTSKSLVNAPKEPSVLLNEDGNILLINESFAQLLEENKDKLIGQNLKRFVPKKVLRQIRIPFERIFERDKHEYFEIEFDDKYYSISIYPISHFENEKSTMAIFVRDITTQKEAEKILKHNQEKLEKLVDKRTKELHKTNQKLKKEIQYRKMAEKELVATEKKKREDLRKLTLQLAHEIKNPLASIKSSAQLLKYMYNNQNDASDSEKILEKMEMISNNVDICNKVVQELYSYTHRSGMRLEKNNLSVVLEEIKSYALDKMENYDDIQIETDFEIEDISLKIDLFKILQAFKNLINNAFDAIEDEGTISLFSRKNEHVIQIAIQDDGVGIADNHLEKIYEPFYTSKVKGFGIGLSVVKEIIDGHNGDLEIKSEAGKGTKALVSLPIIT